MAREKRSFIDRLFGNRHSNSSGSATQFKLLNGYQAQFTAFDGSIYDDSDVRACIDTIARNGAKMYPKHIQTNTKGFRNASSNLQRIISIRPNELQNAYQFYYYIITELERYNDAYVYIARDNNYKPIALYPLHYMNYKVYEYGDDLYFKFSFGGSKSFFCNSKDLIHLTRFVGNDGISGGNNYSIIKILSTKHVLDEGLVNAIKTTQSIRGFIKTTKAMLKPEDVKTIRDTFVKDFINDADGSGIGGLDATSEFTPVKLEPQTASDSQIKQINDKVLSYFGLNENIIQSKFSEDEWNAFYESVLEPIGLQMGLEFTNKIFTLGELQHGNKIIFTSNRLQYASNNTKINLIRYANNLMTIDELREVLNLEPLPDGEGEKIMQDLNHIDGKIANDYQLDNNAKGDENNE